MDQVRGAYDGGELLVQVGRGDARELVRGDHHAVGPGAVERVGGVEREQHLVPEVTADPRGGLAAVVGGDAGDHHSGEALLAQPGVEVGGAVEAGVDQLRDPQV